MFSIFGHCLQNVSFFHRGFKKSSSQSSTHRLCLWWVIGKTSANQPVSNDVVKYLFIWQSKCFFSFYWLFNTCNSKSLTFTCSWDLHLEPCCDSKDTNMNHDRLLRYNCRWMLRRAVYTRSTYLWSLEYMLNYRFFICTCRDTSRFFLIHNSHVLSCHIF